MGGGHRGIRWTAKEDNLLRDLIVAKASDTMICAKLRRSPEAIRMRLLALQKRQEEQMCRLAPTPELPDAMRVTQLELPPRIQRVLLAEGLTTVGEIRETSDDTMVTFQDFGQKSVAFLRDKLGLPSKDGVRSVEKR